LSATFQKPLRLTTENPQEGITSPLQERRMVEGSSGNLTEGNEVVPGAIAPRRQKVVEDDNFLGQRDGLTSLATKYLDLRPHKDYQFLVDERQADPGTAVSVLQQG
jgi:hypothetical protein